MLNFASHELNDWRENNQNLDAAFVPSKTKTAPVKILAEKIIAPPARAEIKRPRLFEHLEKSLKHFSATFINGRAGTGKTTLAADFANQSDYDLAWYKTESTDTEWKVFFSYFSESLRRFQTDSQETNARNKKSDSEVLSVTESVARQFALIETTEPLLIVLDDLHSVFDADWFGEFFNALLSLPSANVRVLLLARALPSFPLWRLRSKQFLDVMDEKLLAFTVPETVELFKCRRLSAAAACSAHKRSYGRIAKLREIAEKTSVE